MLSHESSPWAAPFSTTGSAPDEQGQAKSPPGPKIVRMLVGDDAFAYVEAVLLDASTQVTNQYFLG